jgi:hypothetical protein
LGVVRGERAGERERERERESGGRRAERKNKSHLLKAAQDERRHLDRKPRHVLRVFPLRPLRKRLGNVEPFEIERAGRHAERRKSVDGPRRRIFCQREKHLDGERTACRAQHVHANPRGDEVAQASSDKNDALAAKSGGGEGGDGGEKGVERGAGGGDVRGGQGAPLAHKVVRLVADPGDADVGGDGVGVYGGPEGVPGGGDGGAGGVRVDQEAGPRVVVVVGAAVVAVAVAARSPPRAAAADRAVAVVERAQGRVQPRLARLRVVLRAKVAAFSLSPP